MGCCIPATTAQAIYTKEDGEAKRKEFWSNIDGAHLDGDEGDEQVRTQQQNKNNK